MTTSNSKADKKMLDEVRINFFGKKEEYKSLSNFSKLEVVIGDGTPPKCILNSSLFRLGYCNRQYKNGCTYIATILLSLH